MAAEASCAAGDGGHDARMKLLCSHSGRLVPFGPDGAPRYVGGQTRVLVLPRAATFRVLAARLGEMTGGADVAAVRYRLTDEGLEDVLVSVTCNEELAHTRDEYDRLRATRPTAGFRVFVSTASSNRGGGVQQQRAATGLPPRRPAPAIRRVQSEQAIAARAHLHRRPAAPAPMRRVQSSRGARRVRPSFYQRRHQCRCVCHSRDLCALPYMSKNVNGVGPGGQEAAPVVPAAKATCRVAFLDAAREKTMSRHGQAAMENGRCCRC